MEDVVLNAASEALLDAVLVSQPALGSVSTTHLVGIKPAEVQ